MTNKVHRRELAAKKSFTPPAPRPAPPYAKHSKNIVIHKRAREVYILPFGITKSQPYTDTYYTRFQCCDRVFHAFSWQRQCVKNNNNVLLRAFNFCSNNVWFWPCRRYRFGFGRIKWNSMRPLNNSRVQREMSTFPLYHRLFHLSYLSLLHSFAQHKQQKLREWKFIRIVCI